jgi:non-ribosomal peptide synthetase component F
MVQRFEGDTMDFEIGEEETKKLETTASRQETTLYMVLLSIFYIVLARTSGQEDIIIGTLVEGRRHDQLRSVIGMFVNTLPLRNFPQGKKSFHSFLNEVKKRTLEALENQDYQFDALIKTIPLVRDISRNPLFDVTFVFQNMEIPELVIPGLKTVPYKYQHPTAKFDITLIGSEKENKLFFTLRYRTTLFKKATIRRYVRYFREVVAAVLQGPFIKLKDIAISHDLKTVKTSQVQTEFVF